MVDDIISSGNCKKQLKSIPRTQRWVHSLLQEISIRLSKSLELVPDKIPHISRADTMGAKAGQWIDAAKMLKSHDKNFLERYLNILVLADGGIGNPKLSEGVMRSFAELLDKSIAESSHLRALDSEAMYALETGVHMVCGPVLSKQYRKKILMYLHTYFQSIEFSRGNPIRTDEEFNEAIKPSDHSFECGELNIDNLEEFTAFNK